MYKEEKPSPNAYYKIIGFLPSRTAKALDTIYYHLPQFHPYS